MVLCVALNAAVDVTYAVDRLPSGEAARVRTVEARPGGKAVNVARVLRALGEDVTVTGFAGGCRGGQIRSGLATEGISDQLVPIAGESRQTLVAVADDGSFAEFDEAGPDVTPDEWDACLRRFGEVVAHHETVVLAGSLPPGLTEDAYATLVATANDAGATVLLDAGGEALRRGLAAKPRVVKVNTAELSSFAGREVGSERDVVEVGTAMVDGGVAMVVVTLGSAGAVALTPDDAWRIRQPPRAGSPVGAGDAFTAGLVASAPTGLVGRLRFATALAASSVGQLAAGTVDVGLATRLEHEVEVVAL